MVISLIGAGSIVFSKQLMINILSFSELEGCTFCLMDIDAERLTMIEQVARMFIEQKRSKSQIVTTMSLEDAVSQATYVINLVQVGGFSATKIDFEIPARYGLKQTIADTLGVGGIFRGLRTIPVLDQICQVIEERNPDAVLLNYTNPMAILSQYVLQKYPGVRYVGLCHSVQTTSKQLALYLDIPWEELQVRVAGINHQAWFLSLKHKGQDCYPKLFELKKKIDRDPGFVPEHLYAYTGNDSWFRENFKESAAETFATAKVRFELLDRLGYYVTESSEHNAEYCPYFIRDEDLVKKFKIPINEYFRRCEINLDEFALIKETIRRGEELHVDTSQEYAGFIIHSMETGVERTINGNVLNTSLITNLPQGCAVEVPCLINRNGVQPTFIGELPPQLAAYNQTNVNVHMLVVAAALERRREHVYHAVMMDPLASSMLNLDQMWKMTSDMFDAHGSVIEYLR